MELSKIAKITHLFLKLFFVVGIVLLFFMKSFVIYLGGEYILQNTIVYTIIGIFCLYIVYEIIKVFKSIVNNNPFVRENEISLKKIAVTCEIIAILFFIQNILFKSLLISMTSVIIIIFAIAGLCAYVFSQLFKQSAIIKEENDMTI